MNEKIEYKGCIVEIIPDECIDSPDSWGDDNLFLVGYHRDFSVNHKKIDKGLAQEIARQGFIPKRPKRTADDGQAAEFMGQEYHFFPLEAYIHSGVVLALGGEGDFPDRRWDVLLLGLVAVSKSEWRTRKKARTAALGLIATWNDYLSGNVYGFRALDEQGGEINSCWGFYGDPETSGIIDEGKSDIDLYLKDKKEVLHDLVVMA